MATIYSTKSYARSEIGRALTEATQFAHLSISDIFNHLDENEKTLATPIRIADEKDCIAMGFNAGTVIWEFSSSLGTICPMCLCPFHHPTDLQELYWMKKDATRNRPFLPGWLTLYNQFDYQPVHDECKTFASAMECIGSDNISRQRDGAALIANKRFLERWRTMIMKKDVPELRFDPRRNTENRQRFYQPIRTHGTEWRDGDIRRMPS